MKKGTEPFSAEDAQRGSHGAQGPELRKKALSLFSQGIIFDLDETATHDGPGLRLAVYLKGCPLRCIWCHSPESISPEPQIVWYETRCTGCGACGKKGTEPFFAEGAQRGFYGAQEPELRKKALSPFLCESGALAIKGREATAGEILRRAEELLPFFARSGGGVTLTGGDPLFQPDFACAIAALCRDRGIHVAVETCGFAPWRSVRKLAAVTDLWLFDVKEVDDKRHREFTGVSCRRILDNLHRLLESGADVIVRVPCIPGHNDSPERIEAIVLTVAALGADRITLLPFNPASAGKYSWLGRPYPLADAERQSDAEMEALEAIAREIGLTVVPP